MKLRLFLVIFFVIFATVSSVSYIHFYFFKVERLRLIELNLEQNATLISNADITLTKNQFRNLGKDFISSTIGDDKVNMIVAIYSLSGDLLYKNDNATVFNVPAKHSIPFEEWENVEGKDYFIKYLTITDKEQGRIIKVGMILNQSLLRWKDLNQRILVFAVVILVFITFISFFLSRFLFRPLRHLSEIINHMTDSLDRTDFEQFNASTSKIHERYKSHEEFQNVINSLDRLSQKLIDSQGQTQRWSALMAHELKTPMTLLRNSFDGLIQDVQADKKFIVEIEEGLFKLESIVNDFLEWASLENDPGKPEMHVVPLLKRSQQVVEAIQKSHPGHKITLNALISSEKRIFCNPIHFDQLIGNLLTNAIKYGKDSGIEITVNDDSILVHDSGAGIPKSVVDNFGRPFNRYKQGNIPGYGLGLAWVNTIAKKYGWVVSFDNQGGTTVKILIPLAGAT